MAMSEAAPEPPTTDGGTDSQAQQDSKIDALAGKVEQLAEAVSRLIPGSHAEAQQQVEGRLDRPARTEEAVQEQVRAELARAREAEQRQQAEAGERETLNARLAKLEEKPPEPPVRWVTRSLGWKP